MLLKTIKKFSWINFLVFWISLVVSLLLAELLMRSIFPEYNPKGNIIFQFDEEGVIIAPPSFSGRQWRNTGEFNVQVSINQYGFRDQKSFLKSKNTDWFVIGDSFFFGHGVEEKDRFDSILQGNLPDSISIFNLAISRSDLLDYQKKLEYLDNRKIDARNIIVGICMENDIKEYSKINFQERFLFERNKSINFKDWLNRNSCIYNLISVNLQTNEQLRKFLIQIGFVKDSMQSLAGRAVSEKGLNESANLLANMVDSYNALIVIIPSRLNWVENHKEITRAQHQSFIQILKSKNISTLDLLPYFENVSSTPLHELHFKYDGHWNNRAHTLVGNHLLNFVKEE